MDITNELIAAREERLWDVVHVADMTAEEQHYLANVDQIPDLSTDPLECDHEERPNG